MNDQVAPLPPLARKMLDQATELDPPDSAEQRILERVHASLALPPPLPPASSPATSSASAAAQTLVQAGPATLAIKSVLAIATAVLGVGLGGGVLLGRTVLAPEPVVRERVVRVEVPAIATPVPAGPERAPSVIVPPERVESPSLPPLRKKAPAIEPVPTLSAPPVADLMLARERELIDTARSALLHGDAVAALRTLNTHDSNFSEGRLEEERESLWVMALMMKGDRAEAQARAKRFHERFPRSLIGPTIDAALAAP